MELLAPLASHGILGLFCAIFGGVIVFQNRVISNLQDKRLNDASQNRDLIINSLRDIQKTLDKFVLLLEAGSRKGVL